MKVKIGDQIYDSAVEPILVMLEGNEKELISSMQEVDKRFCVCPDNTPDEVIVKFMNIGV